ncbi:hypothetical protein FRB90_010027, partial [Tulasnella sp. 427]
MLRDPPHTRTLSLTYTAIGYSHSFEVEYIALSVGSRVCVFGRVASLRVSPDWDVIEPLLGFFDVKTLAPSQGRLSPRKHNVTSSRRVDSAKNVSLPTMKPRRTTNHRRLWGRTRPHREWGAEGRRTDRPSQREGWRCIPVEGGLVILARCFWAA